MDGAMAEASPYSGVLAVGGSFLCTVAAIALSSWHIAKHLQNYTEPIYQRHIVRIIFMVPVYATMSFCALAFQSYAMYFNTIRDVYEAWVIYNFLALCLAWVGGPGAVVVSLSGRLLKPSYLLMTCFLPPIPLDGRFIRRCKQGCLQFVFLKPILAATCLLLYNRGLYHDGDFSLADSYLYITCVYMASYTVAIYALILFYVACKDLLHSFNPIPKFLMIKAVVFLTYWQGVVIFTIGELGWVKGGAEDAADLQNVLICFEMALGSLGFLFAFPFSTFAADHAPNAMHSAGGGTEGAALTESIKHAIDLNDLVSDTVHQFAPSYHDYVLYSNGSQDGPQVYRARTFVPKGTDPGSLQSSASNISKQLDSVEVGLGGQLVTDDSSEALSSQATSLSRENISSMGRRYQGEDEEEEAVAGQDLKQGLLEPELNKQAGAEEAGEGGVASQRIHTVPVGGGGSIMVRLPPPPQDAKALGEGQGQQSSPLRTGASGQGVKL